jgi:hypothetical protein
VTSDNVKGVTVTRTLLQENLQTRQTSKAETGKRTVTRRNSELMARNKIKEEMSIIILRVVSHYE